MLTTIDEKELFELLTHAMSGSTEDHKRRRVQGLEELQRRIETNSVQDKNTAVSILLDMAKTCMHAYDKGYAGGQIDDLSNLTLTEVLSLLKIIANRLIASVGIRRKFERIMILIRPYE